MFITNTDQEKDHFKMNYNLCSYAVLAGPVTYVYLKYSV